MARSNRAIGRGRVAWGLAMVAGISSCNALLGLSDLERAECSGGACPSVVDPTPERQPVDARAPDREVPDAAGTNPVRWAAFRMPNYVPPDSGVAIDNAPMSYELVAGDGLRDVMTNLVWRHPMPAGSTNLTYADALARCNAPWRLPSRIELVTLLDLAQPGAKIAPAFQGAGPAVAQGVHWTLSEVRPFDPRNGARWVVDFGEGGVKKRAEQAGRAAVLCVKGGTP